MQLEAIYVYCHFADVTDVDMEEKRRAKNVHIVTQKEEKKKVKTISMLIESRESKCAQ